MPRASRTSQAAAATAYMNELAASAAAPTSAQHQSTSTSHGVDDSMWSRRSRAAAAASGGHGSAQQQHAVGRLSTGTTGNSSSFTDPSVSSASVISPTQSSHAPSEASSYATRTVPGVADEEDMLYSHGQDDTDDDDEVEVLASRRRGPPPAPVRSGRAIPPAGSARSAGAGRHSEMQLELESGQGSNIGDVSSFSAASTSRRDQSHLNTEEELDASAASRSGHFSSRLLEEVIDDDDPLGNATMANQGETDSLADASPEEVEQRALEALGWDEIGEGKPLPVIDLERWKTAPKEMPLPDTPEYQVFQAIQAELLLAVQELETTDWMYSEPLPFASHNPNPSLAPGQAQSAASSGVSSLLAHASVISGSDHGWADAAFNPLSTFAPLAPSGLASYPDTYRVQRALGNHEQETPAPHAQTHAADMSTARQQSRHDGHNARYGIAPGRPMPDLSFLDTQAQDILGDQDTSFAAMSSFPWAAPVEYSANTRKRKASQAAKDRFAMLRANSSSLTRDVGVITL